RKGSCIAAGSIVTRSFCPLPSRTRISWRRKSTSWTRRLRASNNRSPAPYSKLQTNRGTPPREAKTIRTSSRLRTTGSRLGRLARTTPRICSRGTCNTCLVEEQQGRERLVLGRGADVAADGQVGQEPVDLGGAHGGGVADAVEEPACLKVAC